MTRIRFFQLDVFTTQPFGGNPLAVFPDADDLSSAVMQQIAREMNLSETVFVQTPTDARAVRRLRIFTPTRELPMAGHPVVGTWNLLARTEAGGIVAPRDGASVIEILQEIALGILPVEIEFANGEPSSVTMTQGAFQCRDVTLEVADIARALGLSPAEIDTSLPLQTASTGLEFLLVPLTSLDALARCRIESTQLSNLYRQHDATGCMVFTARETIDKQNSKAHARMFAPDENIIEDPATGSACGALGAYLVRHRAIETRANTARFQIEQGDFMKRPSRIKIEISVDDEHDITRTKISGASVVVASGELIF